MAGIGPISGGSVNPIGPLRPQGLDATRSGQGKIDFGQTLKNVIDQVDQSQQVSTESVKDLLSGKTGDIMPVVASAAKADLSFKLLIGVRNKVIEAYKQTMNMQI